MAEIINLIPTDTRNKWDKFSYGISSPITINDEPEVIVTLFNEDGSKIIVAFGFHEGVEIDESEIELEADAVWPITSIYLEKA